MFRKLTLAGVALALGATALIPATPAAAQRYQHTYQGQRYSGGYEQRYQQDRRYRDDRGYDRRYQEYRGYDRRRCNNDAGTIIGAIAGGLLGHSVAGRGDRTLGTVLGAGAGAFAGRAIDRSDDPRYCR